MAKFLSSKEVNIPAQGSTDILELVKHFQVIDDFEELQNDMNAWFILINSDFLKNRPHIRSISFSSYIKPANPNKDAIVFLSQVHYFLTGDADDSPSI